VRFFFEIDVPYDDRGNQDYIKANRDLLAAQGRLRTVNLIPEDVSAIIVSKKGFVVASGKAAVREAKRETERLEKTVRIMKPKWMEVMEKNPIVIKAPVAVEAPVVLMEKAKQVKSGKKNSANGKKSNR
jgi:phage host-nuclease inhibitor protein Gam